MRVIRLTHGAGNGQTEACLMTASNMLIGKPEDRDNNSCVCDILRSFIIPTNDTIPIALLGKLYSPLIWEILGTRTNDEGIRRQRALAFVDWLIREAIPLTLNQTLSTQYAAIELGALPEIKDKESLKRAAEAVGRLTDRLHNVFNIKTKLYTTDVLFHAGQAIRHFDRGEYPNTSITVGATIVRLKELAKDPIPLFELCPQIIRKVAAIGDKRPVEKVLTDEQLCEKLGECHEPS